MLLLRENRNPGNSHSRRSGNPNTNVKDECCSESNIMAKTAWFFNAVTLF
jgi:hypothetical protein